MTVLPPIASNSNQGVHLRPSPSPTKEEQDQRRTSEPRTALRSIVIVITLTFGMLINIGNVTALAVSLPTIQRTWNLQPADLQWIVSGYPLASGCLFLVCGRLADLYGRKRSFLLGTTIMFLFTLGCGFSNGVVTLNVLRAIQGIGAAAVIPASLGILATAFPPSRARALAFGMFACGAPIGAVLGYVIGAVFTEFTAHTWRSPFFFFAGLNILCFLGAWFAVAPDAPSEESDKRVDWIGATLVMVGLVFIMFVLSQGEVAPHEWATAYIIALLVVGIFLVGIFLWWQSYLEKIQDDEKASKSKWTPPPLMRISIWTRANGRLAGIMTIGFVNWCCFIAWTYWMQLYFQNYLGISAIQSVLRITPLFVSGIFCTLFVGFMASHIPLVIIVAFGTAATSIACLLFAVIKPEATYWAFCFPAMVLSVMGIDLVFSAGTIFIAKFALPHEQSVAGALFNTMVQLGTAAGVTITTAVFNATSRSLGPGSNLLSAYQHAQWAAFAFGMLGLIIGIVTFRGVGVVGEPRRQAQSGGEALRPETLANLDHPDEKL